MNKLPSYNAYRLLQFTWRGKDWNIYLYYSSTGSSYSLDHFKDHFNFFHPILLQNLVHILIQLIAIFLTDRGALKHTTFCKVLRNKKLCREHHNYTGVPILTHYTMHCILRKQRRNSNFKWLKELLMEFFLIFLSTFKELFTVAFN